MRSRRVFLLGAATLLVAGDVTGCRSAPSPPPGNPAAVDTASPLSVLRTWDRQRAAAYAEGDPAALRALYRPGSDVGDRDVRLLRTYAARGLRVTGLQAQVLAADLLIRRPDRLVLAVTERVTGAVAVGGGGRVRLPQGVPRYRVVVLVRRGDRWVVADVRAP